MALETLKDINTLGGFEVKEVEWNQQANNFIEVNHKHNAITFKIQNGPVKTHGVNGCQVDTVIHCAKTILEGLNSNFPCRENAMAITKLDECLLWLDKRTQDRLDRGVEGQDKA